ncbi:MAG: ATP-binding domain-containing protein [Emticicia sp.]|nr:ATP-binding domain-containing protein [Emticicia sp.]
MKSFCKNHNRNKFLCCVGRLSTGKISLMQTVVQYLKATELNFVLLAPTGKATKILSKRTNDFATTIHHQIYTPEELADGTIKFNFRTNDSDARTVFIVDEASMLQAKKENTKDFVTPNPVLHDLIRHIKAGNSQIKSFLLASLLSTSASHGRRIRWHFRLVLYTVFDVSAQQTTLKEVKRQAENSPILKLANEIKSRKDGNKDLRHICLNRLQNEDSAVACFLRNFNSKHLENIVIIAQSNKRVQELNGKVRQELNLDKQTLSVGDVVMLNQNWMTKIRRLLKGDMGLIVSTNGIVEERAGLHFVDAIIDFEGTKIETKVLINSLLTEKGDIDKEAIKGLKNNRMAKNEVFKASQKASDDPYMSAMHLRYGYAITCHKAQGSEWNKVLIEPQFHLGNHRWLYTAVTRAREAVQSWWY